MFCILVPISTLPIICYLQSSVTNKFTDYLLFTVDCHQQIYPIFAIYSRLSPANLPIICYLQSSVTSKFTDYLLFTVVCHQQMYILFASYSRLSPANLPNICYLQSTVTNIVYVRLYHTSYIHISRAFKATVHRPCQKLLNAFIHWYPVTSRDRERQGTLLVSWPVILFYVVTFVFQNI